MGDRYCASYRAVKRLEVLAHRSLAVLVWLAGLAAVGVAVFLVFFAPDGLAVWGTAGLVLYNGFLALAAFVVGRGLWGLADEFSSSG